MTGEEVKAKRLRLGMNQGEFWGPLGISQSGGSRYEMGRTIPVPIMKLLAISYGTEKQSLGVVTILRGWTL